MWETISEKRSYFRYGGQGRALEIISELRPEGSG